MRIKGINLTLEKECLIDGEHNDFELQLIFRGNEFVCIKRGDLILCHIPLSVLEQFVNLCKEM